MSNQTSIELDPASSSELRNTSESPTIELISNISPSAAKYLPALIVAASFTLTFTACGTNFAFGIYQDLYQSLSTDSTSPFYNASPASIDLIGTLGVSLMSILAPLAGALIKNYHPRVVIFVGGALIGLGNILAGSGTHLWHFTLAQGVVVGAGTSLCYIPAVTVTPAWFNERRGLAMGIVLSGTGVGGVVWAPILHALNASIGYRNTLRFSGALSFVCLYLVRHWL
jgi:MFS family permease